MSDEADEADESEADDDACPYCASTEGCEHLLLVVDLTFRTSDGGALFVAFGDRWNTLQQQRNMDRQGGSSALAGISPESHLEMLSSIS